MGIHGRDQRASAQYRADIDGLRALAVLPIVAFHLGFQIFDGGYVGVDIFFVISGYLIGGIILRETHAGTFSFARFYERRLRRILPALTFMLLGTTAAAVYILFPRPLEEYARSLVASMLSLSNIQFWQQAGYFDSASDAKPLLHTWSLGVEEQFYIVFPPLIYLLLRLRAPLVVALGGLAILSFALSVYGVGHYPTATFFLIHTRAWEFLLGVLAVRFPDRLLANRSLREGVSMIGIASILAVIMLYAPDTPFPGWAALPPCLGTAALLVSGSAGPSLISRLLSWRLVTFFGLISYSLYLWHWPVIVLARQAIPEGWLRMDERFIALAVTIALATLSWRYIERPFRSPQFTARAIFGWSAVAAVLVCAIGIGLVVTRGLPQRFSPEIARIADFIDNPPPNDKCFIGRLSTAGSYDYNGCLRIDPARPNVLVLGDSHANHLVPGLRQIYPAINFQETAVAGCRMTVNVTGDLAPDCATFRQRMFGDYLPRLRPRWVVLSNFWGWETVDQIGPTLDWFRTHGIGVILVGPVTRYEVPLPLVLATARRRGTDEPLQRLRIAYIPDLDRRIAAIARDHGVAYLSPYQQLCPGGQCITVAPNGDPVQYDYGHLTEAGSRIVAAGFPAQLVTGPPPAAPLSGTSVP